MRSEVRKILMLTLATLLLVGVGACGGEDSKSSGGSGDAGKPTELSGKITIWDQTYKAFPAYTKAVDELDAEFERLHPGVTVEHVGQPADKFDELVQAAFTGREGPDIMRFRPGAQGVLRWTKGLEKLNDRIPDAMRQSLTGWNTATVGFAERGDVYGVPYGVIGDVFYYNKKLFKQAGLPTDFQPRTWEEVRDAGLKLKAAGIQPLTDGNMGGIANPAWLTAGWQTENTPEEAIDLIDGKIPYTSDTFARAVEPHLMMQKAGLFDADRFTTPFQPDGVARFGEGKAGMALGFWSLTAYYRDYIPKIGEKNLGIFFPPGADPIGVVPVSILGIPSYGKNKDAAWAYLEFFSSAKSAQKLYDVGGVLPNNSGVQVSPNAPEQERQLLEALSTRETFPWIEMMIPGNVVKAAMPEISEVLQGRKSLADAQEALQEVADQDAG